MNMPQELTEVRANKSLTNTHKHSGGPESEVVKYCFFQKIIVSPRRKHNSAITKTLKFRRLNLVVF